MGNSFIILEQTLVEDLISTLAENKVLLSKMEMLLNDTKKQADENKLMTIQQACAYLGGIGEETLLYYRKMGLSYFKKGREAVWYRKGDIDAWLASGKVNRRKNK